MRNSKFRVFADFWDHDKINDEYPPRFINVHFYFGDNPTNILYLLEDDLKNQKSYKRNPAEGFLHLEGELANEFFKTLALEFTLTVTDNMYFNQIEQFAS